MTDDQIQTVTTGALEVTLDGDTTYVEYAPAGMDFPPCARIVPTLYGYDVEELVGLAWVRRGNVPTFLDGMRMAASDVIMSAISREADKVASARVAVDMLAFYTREVERGSLRAGMPMHEIRAAYWHHAQKMSES